MVDIKQLTRKIREAIYGLDVREIIAQGFDAVYDNELEHEANTKKQINDYKEDTDEKIQAQNQRINELNEHYNQVITSGGDSVLEIVDARVPFNTLKEKLNDIEEKSMNVKDISLGAVSEEENRTLKVYNNDGEMIAIIDKDNTSFNYMEIAELTCENVISKQTALNLYVDANTGDDANDGLSSMTPFKTIMRAVNMLNKYLTANVKIYIATATYNENLVFEGFMGLGSLYVYCNRATINGDIYINSCTTAIRLYGEDADNLATLNHTSSRQSAITIYTTPYAFLQYFEINGNANTKFCVEGNQGGSGAIKSSILNNSNISAVVGYECSNLYVVGCKGSGHTQYSIYSASGSTICLSNTIPDAPKDNWSTTGFIHGTATKTPSVVTSTPEVSLVKTYGSTKQISYRAVDGWSRTAVYQGKYDPSNSDNYLHYGAFVLDSSAMRTDLNGRSIQAVKVTMKRYKEGQGINQPVTVDLNIYGSTTLGSGSKPALTKKYTTVKNVSKNQTVTFTLPNSFVTDVLNNNINSILLYTANGSSYCRMDTTFSIEVTYK